jgi:hypothetical protein
MTVRGQDKLSFLFSDDRDLGILSQMRDRVSGLTRSALCHVIRRVIEGSRLKFSPSIILCCLLWVAHAHGGPPLLTDDPDTPGPNHWEINVATTSEYMSHAWEFATPLLDMNYGVGEHIQLKYQVQANVLAPAQGGVIGVKWRFLDQTNASWLEISTYPQLEFVYPSSSPSRGLADSGDNILLPIEVEHKFEKMTVYAEGGYIWNEHHSSAALYGVAGEYEFSEKFSLMGEFYGGFDRAFEHNGLSFNLGFRQALTEHIALIGSAGRGINGSPERAPAFMSYLALQLTF